MPNDLWHIDQNEKLLKKGGVYIFGMADGATRRIVELYVADHKKPQAVVRAFTDAVTRFGCPARLRSDNGSENVLVWRLMARLRGDESVHRGPSPANIKIEQQWYFTRWNVLQVYRDAYDAFTTLVGAMPKNFESQTPRQYLTMTRLQKDLNDYAKIWNSHKSRAFKPQSTPNEIAL